MLNIKRFICNMLQENCYVANDETRECIIVDCGAFYQEERDMIIDYMEIYAINYARNLYV